MSKIKKKLRIHFVLKKSENRYHLIFHNLQLNLVRKYEFIAIITP